MSYRPRPTETASLLSFLDIKVKKSHHVPKDSKKPVKRPVPSTQVANPNQLDSTIGSMIRYGKQKTKKKKTTTLKKLVLRDRKLKWFLIHPGMSPIPLALHPSLHEYVTFEFNHSKKEDGLLEGDESDAQESQRWDSRLTSPVFFGGSFLRRDAVEDSEDHQLYSDILELIKAPISIEKMIELEAILFHVIDSFKSVPELSDQLKLDMNDVISQPKQVMAVFDNNPHFKKSVALSLTSSKLAEILKFTWVGSLSMGLQSSHTDFSFCLTGLDVLIKNSKVGDHMTSKSLLKHLFLKNSKFQGTKRKCDGGLTFIHSSSGVSIRVFTDTQFIRWKTLAENVFEKCPVVFDLLKIVNHWSMSGPDLYPTTFIWINLILSFLVHDILKLSMAQPEDVLALLSTSSFVCDLKLADLVVGFFTYYGFDFQYHKYSISVTKKVERVPLGKYSVMAPFDDTIDLFKECTDDSFMSLLWEIRRVAVSCRSAVETMFIRSCDYSQKSQLSKSPHHKIQNAVPVRPYVQQVLSDVLDETVSRLLGKLMEFQERLRLKDPVKSDMRRRLVFGFREVVRGIRSRRCKCIIVATNIESGSSSFEGGLDDKVKEMIQACVPTPDEQLLGKSGVAIVFALSKRQLGRALDKKVGVSVVGIYNADGDYEDFRSMLNMADKCRKQWVALVQEERESGHTLRCSQCDVILEFIRCYCTKCHISRCKLCSASPKPCKAGLYCSHERIPRIMPHQQEEATKVRIKDDKLETQDMVNLLKRNLNVNANVFVPSR